ncbi:IS3 family transposase [Bacillus sp. Y1]
MHSFFTNGIQAQLKGLSPVQYRVQTLQAA